MANLGIFGLEFQNPIAIFEIDTLSLFLMAKFHEKTKVPKIGTINALFMYSCVIFLKNNCHI